MATAQSLAETTAMHLSMSRTLMRSPASRYTQLPPNEAARSLAVTVSSGVKTPLSMASIMSSSVMIFVTLAGKPGSSAFFSNSTVPVSFSIRIADGAAMVSAGASASAEADRGIISRDTVRARHRIFFMAPSGIHACFCQEPMNAGSRVFTGLPDYV